MLKIAVIKVEGLEKVFKERGGGGKLFSLIRKKCG